MKIRIFITIGMACAAFCIGCSNNPGTTRQQAANVTEQLKRDTREAAGNIKKGAEVAKTDITAAAEGVKEGLNDKSSSQVNVNTASKADLMGLSGIDELRANAIVANRPYRHTHEIVSKGAVSEAEYQRISSRLSANSSPNE